MQVYVRECNWFKFARLYSLSTVAICLVNGRTRCRKTFAIETGSRDRPGKEERFPRFPTRSEIPSRSHVKRTRVHGGSLIHSRDRETRPRTGIPVDESLQTPRDSAVHFGKTYVRICGHVKRESRSLHTREKIWGRVRLNVRTRYTRNSFPSPLP